MSRSSTKKFAAIMFTDIANFTHYMAVDEKKSLRYLEQKKNKLNNLVNDFNGHYIKDIGDGTLTYFDKSIDLYPEYVEAIHNRGVVYEFQGKKKKAKQFYLKLHDKYQQTHHEH